MVAIINVLNYTATVLNFLLTVYSWYSQTNQLQYNVAGYSKITPKNVWYEIMNEVKIKNIMYLNGTWSNNLYFLQSNFAWRETIILKKIKLLRSYVKTKLAISLMSQVAHGSYTYLKFL